MVHDVTNYFESMLLFVCVCSLCTHWSTYQTKKTIQPTVEFVFLIGKNKIVTIDAHGWYSIECTRMVPAEGEQSRDNFCMRMHFGSHPKVKILFIQPIQQIQQKCDLSFLYKLWLPNRKKIQWLQWKQAYWLGTGSIGFSFYWVTPICIKKKDQTHIFFGYHSKRTSSYVILVKNLATDRQIVHFCQFLFPLKLEYATRCIGCALIDIVSLPIKTKDHTCFLFCCHTICTMAGEKFIKKDLMDRHLLQNLWFWTA